MKYSGSISHSFFAVGNTSTYPRPPIFSFNIIITCSHHKKEAYQNPYSQISTVLTNDTTKSKTRNQHERDQSRRADRPKVPTRSLDNSNVNDPHYTQHPPKRATTTPKKETPRAKPHTRGQAIWKLVLSFLQRWTATRHSFTYSPFSHPPLSSSAPKLSHRMPCSRPFV